MKIITYSSGALLSLLILMGFTFKLQYWPGSTFLLVIGYGGLVLIFLPLFIIYQRKINKPFKKPLLIMLFFLLFISYVEYSYSSICNASAASSNTFITLHNQLERSIKKVESFNNGLSNEFASKLETLKANGAPSDELDRVESYKNAYDEISTLTRLMSNDIVKRNLFLLIYAADPTVRFENFDYIEEVFDNENYNYYEAKANLKAIVNYLDLIYPIEKDYFDYQDGDEYFNNLFDIDEFGYIHIKNLSEYYLHNDLEVTTRILVGNNFEEIALEGLHLMDNLHHFRNGLIALIANHPSDTLEGGIVYDYKFDTTLIEDPDFLISEGDRKAFELIVDSIINFELEENKLDPKDAETVKSIYLKLTVPKKFIVRGDEYPWIWKFHHTSLAAATGLLASLKLNILESQTLASQLIESRVKTSF